MVDASLLKQRVNTVIGSLFIATVAFWAGNTIWQATTGSDPVTNAFAAVLVREYDLENY